MNLILSLFLVLTFSLFFTEWAKAREDTEKKGGEGLPEIRDDSIRLTEKHFKRMDITIEKGKTKDFSSVIEATSEIQFNANKLFRIKPRVQGRVVEVFADFGQEVKKGEKLAMLDSLELARILASYRATKAHVEVAQSNYEREKRLWEKKVSSEKEMLTARREYLTRAAELEEAREKLHLLGLTDEAIESLCRGECDTSMFPVLSPSDGTVVDRKITLGEIVEPTDTLFTIADLNVMWIITDIYEKDLSQIKLNQNTEVLVKAFPQEKFPGKITYISSMVDEKTRTLKTRTEVDNKDRKLKAGMFASVRIYSGESEKAPRLLLVPSVAIQRHAGRKIVFVHKGDYTFEVRPVETGEELEGFTAVLNGLKEEEEVVTKGSFYLKSEMLKEALEKEKE